MARDAAEPSGCPSRCCAAVDHSAARSTPAPKSPTESWACSSAARSYAMVSVDEQYATVDVSTPPSVSPAQVGARVPSNATTLGADFAADVVADQYACRLFVSAGINSLRLMSPPDA